MVATAANFQTISVKDLHKRCCQESVDLIDVRTPAEFREVHSKYARNVPLDSLKPREAMASRPCDPDAPLYVICRSGNRSTKACEAFAKEGYTNIVNVEGGTAAWEAEGLPVNRGKKTISLERQVRIAAGSLVVLGVAGGFFVHPALYALSAFVGAGLVFAGVTDTCGMGMLLAKAPWNQAGKASGTAPKQESSSSCCST